MHTATLTGVALLVCAGLAAPARADIEADYLVCSGTIAPGTLSKSAFSSVANTLRCTKGSASEAGGASIPSTWYDGPATSAVYNTTLAPAVVQSGGELEFSVGGQVWAVTWEDRVIDNVMPFANGTNADLVRRVGSSEPEYHIYAGAMRDIAPCPDEYIFPGVPDSCLTGPAHDFWFVAERVYDLPV